MTDTVILDTLVTKSSLVLAESDTGNIAAKVLCGKSGKSCPSTANVEDTVFGFEIKLVADEGELIVLEFFKGFGSGGIHDDTRSVDHSWT